jgi:tetratricopeptide (TPR) repeat protein
MAENYMFLRRYPEALKYVRKCLKINTTESTWFLSFYNFKIGRVFWHNGYMEEAESYFNKHIKNCARMIELGETTQEKSDRDPEIACIYLIRGEKAKAYKILEAFNKKKVMSLYDVEYFKNDPVFDNIRDEPRFRRIFDDIESKYQAEHERVRKWIGEQQSL